MTATGSIVAEISEAPGDDSQTERPGVRRRARRALSQWWVWTQRPQSYRGAWDESAVDVTRLPAGSPWWLLKAWQVSNWLDRPLLFALMVVFPAGLQGPLRWVAVRPTRRWGTYLLVAAVVVALRATGGR